MNADSRQPRSETPKPFSGTPPTAPPPRTRYWLPRTIRLTREGWWFIGTTFAIGLAATNTGNNLLYMILAMLLSFLAISGMLSEQTMRRVIVRREVPRRLFRGVPATFGVWLFNAKRRLPSYALHVTEADPCDGSPQSHFFLHLGPQAREAWQYSLTFPRRGRHWLPGLQILTRFPFGLFTKISRPILRDPVLVYPAIRPLTAAEVPAALDPGWRARDRRGQGAGLHNLRPYRAGDDPRLIHWKTSAKTGDLMVKELEDEDRPRISLLLEDPPPGATEALVEANLSYAASLAAHAIRREISLRLITAEGTVEYGQGEAHLDRVLERLALYETASGPRALELPADVGRTVRVLLGAPPPAPAEGQACSSDCSSS